MNKKIFKLLTFCLVFLILYISFGIFGIFQINENSKILFKTKEKLEFHKKYSDKMHHLRDSNRWGETENNYLFSNHRLKQNRIYLEKAEKLNFL